MKTKTDPTKVETVLAEAQRIIDGPRRHSYGPSDASFRKLAAMWTVILEKKLTSPISSREADLCMIALKLVRDSNKPDPENIVDIAGYAGLAEHLS